MSSNATMHVVDMSSSTFVRDNNAHNRFPLNAFCTHFCVCLRQRARTHFSVFCFCVSPLLLLRVLYFFFAFIRFFILCAFRMKRRNKRKGIKTRALVSICLCFSFCLSLLPVCCRPHRLHNLIWLFTRMYSLYYIICVLWFECPNALSVIFFFAFVLAMNRTFVVYCWEAINLQVIQAKPITTVVVSTLTVSLFHFLSAVSESRES